MPVLGGTMKIGIGYCNGADALSSGEKVAREAMAKARIEKPALVFAFCSGQLDHDQFFRGLQCALGDRVPIIGGSAVGIITREHLSYDGFSAGVAVIESKYLRVEISAVDNLKEDAKSTGRKLISKFSGNVQAELLLIFYDSIKFPPTQKTPPAINPSSKLLRGIEQEMVLNIPVLGAGLVGDYLFSPTKQFCGSHVASQALVGVMLGGDFNCYHRIMHGCTPLDGVYHTITKIDADIIHEINDKPAAKLIDELYGNQGWRKEHPVRLLTLGINHGERFEDPRETHYVNRLITGVMPDGKSIGIFEPDFEPGTEIQFMLRDSGKMMESARKNSEELMREIQNDGKKPHFGFYIDCAGRTAGFSHTETEEAAEIQEVFHRYDTPLFGFYSGVEIAPLLHESRGLDWTGVLIVFAGEIRDA